MPAYELTPDQWPETAGQIGKTRQFIRWATTPRDL